ncbi:MAG TPA: PEGA domain-containing protein, partial [Myxococcota bacterium]
MLAAVVLCALAVAGPTPPRDGPVYAGIAARDPSLDAQAERAAIALGQALEKRGITDLGSPPLPDAAGDGSDAQLVTLVTAAKGKFLEGDFQQALERADAGVARFESGLAFRAGAGGPAWSAYADAQLVRALALRRLGKEPESDQTLAELLAVLPKVQPDPALTPPKVAQRFQQLTDEIKNKPRASVEVTSSPAGADVVVDGIAQGKSPVVVRDLFPGTHFVALSIEGDRVERKVPLVAGGNSRVEEKIGDPRAVPARALRQALTTPLASELLIDKAKEVGDDVIVGALVPDVASKDSAWLVVGRVHAGALLANGVRIDRKASPKSKAELLADAVVAAKPDGAWISTGSRAGADGP